MHLDQCIEGKRPFRWDMRLRHTLTALLYGLCLCSRSMAEAVYSLDIPAGELTTALDILAHQTHAEFIYSADEIRGVKTRGVHGDVSAEAAVQRLLEGTHLVVKVHPSGALLITSEADSFQTSPASGALPGSKSPEPKVSDLKAPDLREVVILGTRRGASQVASTVGTSGIGIVDSATPVEIVGADALTQVGAAGSHPGIAPERAFLQLLDHERRHGEPDVVRSIAGPESKRYVGVDQW